MFMLCLKNDFLTFSNTERKLFIYRQQKRNMFQGASDIHLIEMNIRLAWEHSKRVDLRSWWF